MKKNIKNVLILIVLVIVLLLPYFVFAQSPLENLKSVGTDAGFDEADKYTISKIAGLIVNAVLGLLGIIFVSLMLYAGYNWMTAAGDETKLTQAKNTIRRAIIGIVILVSAMAIYNFVLYNFIFK